MIEERNEKKEFVLNEKVLEVFVDDRCFNGSYVWYDVLECLCARSYLLQSYTSIHGVDDGCSHGSHHAVVHVENV
ncbi:hypothetical protein CU024_2246 [Enterococcus faecium]|nr:hypothetical protein [Enterococcus faecium]